MATKASPARWRFLTIVLAMPLLGSTLGIDGGAIFQILAVETLELDPRAIGIAFGMGVVSVPLQLVAARTPLWRARRNVQRFFTVAATLCGVLAVLVALDAGGERLAFIALGVTVLAEVSLSVQYAPAWQPLLSFALSTEDRQRVNIRGRAAGTVVAAAVMVVFGAASDGGRALILALVAIAAAVLVVEARRLPAPARPVATADIADAVGTASRLPPVITSIYWTGGLIAAVATWPLFIVYVREALWPTVNLGLLGATQLGGSLLAAVLWRPTADDIRPRAARASAILLLATIAVAAIRVPADNAAESIATFVALAAAACATSTMLMAVMERMHREVDERTSVRALTFLDVVGSTSVQGGLLVAGFLVSFSVSRTDWLLDPYRIFLLAGAVAVAATTRLRPSA